MATRSETVTGIGTLRGNGRQRKCSFRVVKNNIYVDEETHPVKATYSGLSITDSDDWPDADYEIDFAGRIEPLTRKGGKYLARQ